MAISLTESLQPAPLFSNSDFLAIPSWGIVTTSTQLPPFATLFAKGGLWSQNCLAQGHILRLDMFCGRTCLTCLFERHIVREYMSYWRACFIGEFVLLEDIICRRTGLIGGHILLEGMSCRRTYLTGGHVLHKGISYGVTCLAAKYVLRVDCLMEEHVLQEDTAI